MNGTDESPGANDNASGIAALLEAARLMSKHTYAASVAFVALSAEEQGLFGGEITMPLPPIAQRGISVRGSYVGSLDELKAVVALARSGKLQPSPVEVRPASEVNRSMEELRDGKVIGRVVLDFEHTNPDQIV
jgi:D-arabinose 1-dehydrogenase-like Zn-dependent alcohol dehydrogenase